MDAIELLLRQLDDLWEHPWDSLGSCLEGGVSEDEAHWQPPAYREVAAEPGWPAPGTIRWQIAHMAHCNRYYALQLELRDEPAEAVPESKPRIALDSLESELEALRTVQRALRATVAAIDAEELDGKTLPDGVPLAEFLAMIVRHNTWHTGQIAMLRRLFAEAQQN